MRAVVTGGCGFIGYNLCKYLNTDSLCDWDVIVIDDLSTGDKKNVVDSVKFKYIFEPITQQLCEPIFRKQHTQVVFHLASVPRVSYSVEYPLETFKSNTLAAISLFESVRKSNMHCRIINSSSSSVYGGSVDFPTKEDHKCEPKSPYALEKYETEKWAQMYANLYDMDIVSLRYFNVFGEGSKFGGAYSTVLSAWMYHLFVDQNYIPFLEGDGSQSRDFCYIDNVVNANILCTESKIDKFNGQCYNIAHGESHTLLACKDILEDICGSELKLEHRPDREGDVKHTLADISAAKKDFRYNPKVEFKLQVKKMCEWYSNYYGK